MLRVEATPPRGDRNPWCAGLPDSPAPRGRMKVIPGSSAHGFQPPPAASTHGYGPWPFGPQEEGQPS